MAFHRYLVFFTFVNESLQLCGSSHSAIFVCPIVISNHELVTFHFKFFSHELGVVDQINNLIASCFKYQTPSLLEATLILEVVNIVDDEIIMYLRSKHSSTYCYSLTA